MQGFGFSPMFGMGGGFGPQAGWGGYQPQQQQAPTGAQRGDARLARLNDRMGNLQEQWKGADTTQQAALQGRIDTLQGKVKGLRQDRRRGQGLYGQAAQGGAQPEPAQMSGGGGRPEPAFMGQGFGGFNPWGGMRPQAMGYGAPQGYQPPQRQEQGSQGGPAQNPGAGFGASGGAPNGGFTGYFEAGNYDTPFGNLVQSNSGDGRLAKMNNGGDQQYGYNPQSGWQVANDQNMGSFVDPYQYAQQAGASRAQYTKQGNFYAATPGTGTYR
jgi:hypothetical protein